MAPLLTKLCTALQGIQDIASADDMDILQAMLNFDGAQHAKPEYVVLPGLRGGVFPADPERPGVVKTVLFQGDCGDPSRQTKAAKSLAGWPAESSEVVAVGLHAPGTGKSKAAMDVLRQHYGFYLDLTTASKDEHWRQAWRSMQCNIEEFSGRLYAAMKVEAASLKQDIPDDSLRPDKAIGLLKPTLADYNEIVAESVKSLQKNLFNQVAAVLLGRAIVLQQALRGRLTPNIWAIFQTTTIASTVFSVCSRIILQNIVVHYTACEIMSALNIDDRRGKPQQFIIFADEFQELAKTRKKYDGSLLCTCVL